MQLTTGSSDIYPEVLKLIMLLADLLNGFIYEIGNMAQTNARTVGRVAFILPGILYALCGLSYFIGYLVVKEEELKIKAVKILMGMSSLVGLTLYLIGDNYYLIEQIHTDKFVDTLSNTTQKIEILNRINAVQPSFLLLSIIFYRVIPQILKIFIREWVKDSSETKNSSFRIGMMNTLMLTTEFDSWFTMVQATSDCSSQLKWVMVMWVLMIIGYVTHMLINRILKTNISNGKDYEFQYFGGGYMVFFIVFAFALYLLGDNRQPLECSSLSARGRSDLKFFFILVAGLIYFIVILIYAIAFFFSYFNGRERPPLTICNVICVMQCYT